MAKRFTDSEKWKKPFIRSMKAPYKLLWLYILDECDHAGIWQVDFDVAEIKIGEKLKKDDAKKYLIEHIIEFENGEKWFIPDFIEFQYGQLNPENRAHNSVIHILTKYNLIKGNKPLTSPLQGAMDMDKDMVKDKDIQVNSFKVSNGRPENLIEVSEYFKIQNIKEADFNAEKFFSFYEAKGWMIGKNKIVDWKSCVKTWSLPKNENKIELTDEQRKERQW